MRPAVVVVGLDCLQGLQSARVLAAAGLAVVGIVKDAAHYAAATRVCHRIVVADTGGPGLVDRLEELGPGFADPPVLLPCQDKNVLIVSRERERLARWYRLALAPHETVETLLDKASFHAYALAAGLPVPDTHVLGDRADAEAAAQALTYPAILKPSVRLREWSRHTRTKALIADGPDELLAHYDRFAPWAEVLLAQQLIRGGDRNHVTCNAYFDRDGEAAVVFTTRKVRQWPPRTGQACASEEVRDDAAVDLTMRVFGGIGYHGLAYLETKRDEVTGEYAIIEANVGRPTGRSASAEAAGVPLLYTMYCDAVGLPLPSGRVQRFGPTIWVHTVRDLQAAAHHWRRGELDVMDWWRSVQGPRAHAIASRDDPRPFLRAVLTALRERGAVRDAPATGAVPPEPPVPPVPPVATPAAGPG